MFIRVSRKDDEHAERAMLVARDEKGKEYAFMYEDNYEELNDLTICDFKIKGE